VRAIYGIDEAMECDEHIILLDLQPDESTDRIRLRRWCVAAKSRSRLESTQHDLSVTDGRKIGSVQTIRRNHCLTISIHSGRPVPVNVQPWIGEYIARGCSPSQRNAFTWVQKRIEKLETMVVPQFP
jgi:hypothetical protein